MFNMNLNNMATIGLNNIEKIIGDPMKKIFLVLVALCAIAAVSFVAAEEVNVEHELFNVPDGYTKDTNITENSVFLFVSPDIRNETIGQHYMEAFSKDKDPFVVMCYPTSTMNFELTQYPSDTPKTIGEYEGYMCNSDTVKGYNDAVAFKYVYHGKIYIIIAPDESIIENALA